MVAVPLAFAEHHDRSSQNARSYSSMLGAEAAPGDEPPVCVDGAGRAILAKCTPGVLFAVLPFREWTWWKACPGATA